MQSEKTQSKKLKKREKNKNLDIKQKRGKKENKCGKKPINIK